MNNQPYNLLKCKKVLQIQLNIYIIINFKWKIMNYHLETFIHNPKLAKTEEIQHNTNKSRNAKLNYLTIT